MFHKKRANQRDMVGFFRITRNCCTEQVVFLGMHAALNMGTRKFITDLDLPFKAVEDLKEILMEVRVE